MPKHIYLNEWLKAITHSFIIWTQNSKHGVLQKTKQELARLIYQDYIK